MGGAEPAVILHPAQHGSRGGLTGAAPDHPRRIAIVSDAWRPQVNGVVRTLSTVAAELTALGHDIEVFGPDRFRTVPMPGYAEIRLAILPGRRLARLLTGFAPDHLHIATEGPLGRAARGWAMRNGLRFTTSFHTRFAEYIEARTAIPAAWIYPSLRRFHNAGAGTMVATASLRADLAARGFTHLRPWTRGVDLSAFRPIEPRGDFGLPRPIFAYVGRLAVEKNIGAFLSLDLPGSRLVVGDGPARSLLQRDHPGAHFTGALFGEDLARAYAAADVMVFPSRTDTFGLVLLEALACGTPIAAYPVTGPADILAGTHGTVGATSTDLRAAALAALSAARPACRAHAERFSWAACAALFLDNLVQVRPATPAA